MRSNVVGDGESSSKVSSKVFHLLDVLKQLSIDALLHTLQLLSPLLLLRLARLHLLLSDLRGVLQLVLGELLAVLEEAVVDVGSHTVKGDAGGGGQDVCGVNAAEGHTIDAVGTGHQQVARAKLLQHDHSAATVGAREQDDHGSGLHGGTAGGGAGLLGGTLDEGLLVVSRVPGLLTISESALGGTAESCVKELVLRWAVEGAEAPLTPVRWTGVARK